MTMSAPTALLVFCLMACVCFSVHCDKSFRVVDEFDAARVSNHYQVTLMGMDIFSVRSKPVLSLLKERESQTSDHNEEEEVTNDLFTLDWDKWWSERGEPVFEALKQNPQFVAAVCFVVAVVRALRRPVVQEMIDVQCVAERIAASLPHQALDHQLNDRIEDMVLQMEQVTKNQDVIARAFARVISILREADGIADDDGQSE